MTIGVGCVRSTFSAHDIHIRDVVKAFLHVMEEYDGMRADAYNVGLSEANLTKLELCERISTAGAAFRLPRIGDWHRPDKRDYVVSNAKIEATSFRPDWSLDAGIEELLKGYRMLRTVGPRTCDATYQGKLGTASLACRCPALCSTSRVAVAADAARSFPEPVGPAALDRLVRPDAPLGAESSTRFGWDFATTVPWCRSTVQSRRHRCSRTIRTSRA